MKPGRFQYFAPRNLGDALSILKHQGDEAKLLAGGQSLVPLMNMRLAQPTALIDLNRVTELSFITRSEGRLCIGAMTRHHEVAASPLVAEACPILSSAASQIGYPAIRHRGTIGGSLAHADPVSELPCVATALDAELVVRGSSGRRIVRAADFFKGYFSTDLGPDEILTEVRFPIASAKQRWAFQEFARKVGDFAIVAVAIVAEMAESTLLSASIALGGVADRPVRAPAAEATLAGQRPDEALIRRAAEDAAAGIVPSSDIHAPGDYRRQLVRTLVARALAESFSRRSTDHA
jgi:aerobic carbon-monoxide dehydrogenase medium subunit